MAINKVKRQTDPFICDGSQTVFPFDFKVFAPTDIGVLVNPSGSWFTKDTALAYGQDYTVTLNENQETNPGGIATLKKPQSQGTRLVVISQIEPLQTLTITRTGGFYPDALNSAFDRAIALIQELLGISKRALLVPQTSSQKPEDVVQDLMNAQTTAKQYADKAQESYQNAKGVEDRLTSQEATLLEDLKAEGRKQVGIVKAEGDTQVERLQTATDQTLVGYGIAGVEQTWTVANDTPSGSTITLPLGMTYVVGHHHLRLVWNGLVLVKDDNFSEIGVADSIATTFKINFDLKQGDQLNAWAIPLGRGDSTNVLERVATVEQSMADLSRTVAYREGAK